MENIAHVHELRRDYSEAIKSVQGSIGFISGLETANFTEGIKRCRKKRWVMMFNFLECGR
jgi:hypothetical protein